jgi:hypothetical protein
VEKPGEVFQNVETGVLEHDHARHEAGHTETTASGDVVLDLGTVEGLSGAPSSLRDLTASKPSEQDVKLAESDTIGKIGE